MAAYVTEARLKGFLSVLKECGGRSGNKSLRERLGWDEELYWKVQGRLIEDGKVEPGRGYGGSVRLPTKSNDASSPTQEKLLQPEATKERDHYEEFGGSIRKWVNRFGFDDYAVDQTHSRGSKDTGGTYTRPDITVVGIKRYLYLPRAVEVLTFEIKTNSSVNIMGVLEAIAHREAANRAYVVYKASRNQFDEAAESIRIFELAQKYGVGIILAPNASEIEGWEVPLDALRNDPDPARLDRFLADHPNKDTQEKLQKWRG